MRKTYIIIILLYTSVILAQMPPHPELLEKIKKGEIATPFAFENIRELKQRGVSREWTSKALAEKNVSVTDKEKVHRHYGPAEITSGTFNAIFLFVEFSDQASSVSVSFFDDLLFSTSSGSMRDYYDEVSYGNLDLTTVDMPTDIGWITVPKSYSYYVDGLNGFGAYPANAQGLARDVVELADSAIDFAPYDNDNDGYIEALFIVHTGPGAEFTGSDDDIWSHAWGIPGGGYLTDDGVRALAYSMEPEYWSSPGDMTIGVYAHEMGHSVFGLPDVYDYDGSSAGTGSWSLMSGGSWNGALGDTPAWPDAYNHIEMGFVTPTNVTSDMISETITAMDSSPDVYKIWKDGSPGSQYFLVQNRQQTGYDSDIPSEGLLIWHIDETKSGNDDEWYPGKTNSGNYLLALEQADGDWDLEKGNNGGDSGDPFPGSGGNVEFNGASTPNSNSYNGTTTYVAVENISASGGSMTADLLIEPPAAALEITSPDGGESWKVNSSELIEWSSTNVSNIDIELSTNSGSTWLTIINNLSASSGQYSWTIPDTPSENCLIRVTNSSDNSLVDESNTEFEITSAPDVEVVSPNGGEIFQVDSEVEILWSSNDVSSVVIEFSTDNGNTWLEEINGTPSDGSYDWTIPNLESSLCLVRITDQSDGSVVDQSDDVFEIITTLTAPQLTSPEDSSENNDLSLEFTWAAVSNADSYRLIISLDEIFSSLTYEESEILTESHTVSQLEEGTKYYWVVNAEANGDDGPISEIFEFTTKLLTPDSLSATAFTHTPNKVHLEWNDNSQNEAGYKIERMGMDLVWSEIDSVNADQNTWAETIEMPETFSYRVRAYNEITQSEYSNEYQVIISSMGDNENIPTSYTLQQNYPNPFNPSTQIKFGLPVESGVKLRIFNILGQTVATLADEVMQSGFHSFEWNAGNISSGIYFYSIEANSTSGEKSFNSVKKMLLVK